MEHLAEIDRSPALAAAVAQELNDELTMILCSVTAPLTPEEKLEEVERAALRCANLSRRLLRYARHQRGSFRTAPLNTLLQW